MFIPEATHLERPSLWVRYDRRPFQIQVGMVYSIIQQGWQHRLVCRVIAVDPNGPCVRYRLIEGTSPAGIDDEFDVDAVEFTQKFVWNAAASRFR